MREHQIPQTQQDKLFNFGDETPTRRAEKLAQKTGGTGFQVTAVVGGETLPEYPMQSCGDQSFLGAELKEKKAFGGAAERGRAPRPGGWMVEERRCWQYEAAVALCFSARVAHNNELP